MFRLPCCLVAAVCCCWAPASLACLWDMDTLVMEREHFPSTLELITGKFLRHSPEYYQWRVEDRVARIEAGEDSPEMYNDLAVAYDKLGQQDKAIETILAKDQLHPGLYETYANLGTFYIHGGQFEKGIEQIDRAIEINPDAHFGREIYQRLLVEYLLSKRQDEKIVLPLASDDLRGYSSVGFAEFLREKGMLEVHEEQTKAQLAKAIKGILGMMRFGSHDSPILLEALGDLLLAQGNADNSGLLAARAYLKASYEAKDTSAADAYRQMAKQSLAMREGDELLAELEAQFRQELDDANQWYAAVRRDEIGWIAGGKNVDEQFATKYQSAPQVIETQSEAERRAALRPSWMSIALRAFIVVGLILFVGILLFGWFAPARATQCPSKVRSGKPGRG